MGSCMCNGWLAEPVRLPKTETQGFGALPKLHFKPLFDLFQQIVAVNVPPEDQDGSGDDSDNFSGSGAGKVDPEP